jgi:hypothetical protein
LNPLFCSLPQEALGPPDRVLSLPTSPLQMVPAIWQLMILSPFATVNVLDGPKRVALCASLGWLCTWSSARVQGSPIDSQSPTRCNVIGHSMTASRPALSLNSTLPHFCLFALSFPRGKIRVAFQKCYYFNVPLLIIA